MESMENLPWTKFIELGPSYAVNVLLIYLLIVRDKQIDHLRESLQKLLQAWEIHRVESTNTTERILDCLRALDKGRD